MLYSEITQLQKKNALYFRNITDGMEKYPYYILEGTEEKHQELLLQVKELCAGEAYADFYFKRVDESGQKLMNEYLSEAQKETLERLLQGSREANIQEELVILPLEEEVLSLLVHISFKELLFSTFYFIQYPCTIWSNYGGRFILFMKDEETCQPILEKARQIGLTLEK